MVTVTFYDFGPFSYEIPGGFRIIAIHSPTGSFPPCKIAHLIRPIIETFLEYFLMEAGTIKAGRHGEFDVML